MNEVVLIITLGFSPGSANHTSMRVLEYLQDSMETCKIQQQKINAFRDARFDYHSICVSRKIRGALE